jgi:hypothetical protein
MSQRIRVLSIVKWIVPFGIICSVSAQQPAQRGGAEPAQARPPAQRPVRPPLFFREDWKQIGPERPADQEAVGNPNLELNVYGPSAKDLILSGNSQSDTTPANLVTILCTTPVAAALRDKSNYVDLTGLAKIRWVTRAGGFHAARPIVKLADGTWLIGDHADVNPTDFVETEFAIASVRWLKLDINRVVTTGGGLSLDRWVDHPDLSKVDEIGFADLIPGSGHGPGGFVNLARFEVYGKSVKR